MIQSRYALVCVVLLLCSSITNQLQADEYKISVQPILPQHQVKQAYQPLADYLAEQTGHTFTITTYKNFLTYWERMKQQKGFDFALDAAHFTDWRVKRQNFDVMARLPDTVSFSLVTNEDNFVFEAEELVMKKIATMSSPGLGGIRLSNMFPNPVRLPFFVQSSDSVDAARRVVSGKADAAIIPTLLVSRFEELNLVDTTEPVPHMGFSSSSKVSENVRQQVQKALVEASSSDAGRRMLEQLNIGRFEMADNTIYDGYAELLQDVFGY